MNLLFLKYSMCVMLMGFILSNNLGAEPFFHDHGRGWHWYQEKPLEEKDAKEEVQPSSNTSVCPHSKTPEERIEAYKAELSRRFAQAWLHPTPKNVMAYQEMQKDMTDRSKIFSTVWMSNVYSTPHLDHTLVSPVNQRARHIHLDLEKDRTKEVIKRLSKSYGLFFFFSGACDYCHAFAPLVAQFARMYNWDVLAISIDGSTLEGFSKIVPDNGLVAQWNIQILPSLYAVNPTMGHVIPIAHGMLSLDQMEARIMALEGRKE